MDDSKGASKNDQGWSYPLYHEMVIPFRFDIGVADAITYFENMRLSQLAKDRAYQDEMRRG